jgi:hypothetical protein
LLRIDTEKKFAFRRPVLQPPRRILRVAKTERIDYDSDFCLTVEQSVIAQTTPFQHLSLSKSRATTLAAITLVLLIVAASRILHIARLTMNWDEVWSIWQTFGTPADIIRWTPNDWQPPYFLFIGAWKELVGIQPFALRVSSLLVYMLGAAFTYRAAKRLGGERAGLFTTLIYGALGFAIFLSLLVRAYTFLLALSSLAFWLTLRYFHRATLWSGLVLALCCVAMWFMHYTAAFVFILLGLLTLFRYGRAIWRWWLPGGIVAIVGILTFLSQREVFATRTVYNGTLPLLPLPQALAEVYGTFTYPAFLVWLVLFVVAGVLLLSRRSLLLTALALLIWLFGPLAIYFLNSRLGLFQDARYLWWAIIGLIFWLGLGLSRLPQRALRIAVGTSIAVIAMLPITINDFQENEFHSFAPIDYNFNLLRENIQPGDVVLVDPNCGCAPDEAWDYYQKIYFPNGLPYVQSAASYRRIWYVSVNWLADEATLASVEAGRVAGKYFGPPNFLIRLYEAPPDPVGILYPNNIRFHGADILRASTPNGPIYHEGETVKLRLWWSVDATVALDYSLSLVVYDNLQTPHQIDGPPHPIDAPASTSQWQPGQFYIDEWEIPLPNPLPDGTYPLWMALYFWNDPQRLTAPGVDERGLLKLGAVLVHSW